jgi:tRNA threonylcarbamoyladenosine dehydratase
MQFSRLIALIGTNAYETLVSKTILIAGLGGVGSFVFEALLRSGIKSLIIVDHDTFDITNCNRQLGATLATVGQKKVDVASSHARLVHPEASIQALNLFIDDSTIQPLFEHKIDYIVDCVDSMQAKLLLIQYAAMHHIPIVCSMGFANKLHPEKIKIAKLNQTSVCPLAKELRRRVKQAGIALNPDVVYSEETPILSHTEGLKLASSSFTPSTAGLLMASVVVNHFIQGGTS